MKVNTAEARHKRTHTQADRGMSLELDGIGMTYQPGTPFAARALDEVALKIETGDRLAIAGPVGSGKSTLLSILAGVEPPSSGKVLHDGREITRRNPPAPYSLGLAFQSPEHCLFEKTVYDDVAFAPRRQGLGGEAARSRVEAALEAIGLDPGRFGHRSPFSLSTGEQRRVALAGVMAMKPRALLLDEPTAYLDPVTRRDLIDRLVGFNKAAGVTMIMVGHDMDELARFASGMVIIDGGRKVAEGPAARLLTDTTLLARHRLDPPGTVQLCWLISQAAGMPVPPVLDEEQAVEILLGLMGKEGGKMGKEG